MRALTVVTLVIALTSSLPVVSRQSPVPPLGWTYTLPEPVLRVDVSAEGGCAAALSASMLTVFDRRGTILWSVATGASRVTARPAVAIAPACGWAAVWTSSQLRLVRRDGSSILVALSSDDGVGPETSWTIRSLEISPDGNWFALGTERGRLLMISSAGEITRRVRMSESEPVVARFGRDSDRVAVTAFYHVGVITTAGEWVWQRVLDFSKTDPSDDLTGFAGQFTPSHGPQGGIVGMIDAAGRTLWTREVWSPSIALAADGSVMAFSAIISAKMPDPNREPADVWVVDRTGSTTVHAEVSGWIDGFSPDGSCILMHEHNGAQERLELVGRNRQLREAWRIPVAGLGTEWLRRGMDLMVWKDRVISAYRLPACSAGG